LDPVVALAAIFGGLFPLFADLFKRSQKLRALRAPVDGLYYLLYLGIFPTVGLGIVFFSESSGMLLTPAVAVAVAASVPSTIKAARAD
jgi:hypothetical protein